MTNRLNLPTLFAFLLTFSLLGCQPPASQNEEESASTAPPKSQVPAAEVPESTADAPSDATAQKPAPPQSAASLTTSPGLSVSSLMWNVESEGADSEVIAAQLKEMKRYDIYALSEVLPQDLKLFRKAVGMNYRYLYSRSGYNDRLQLLYDTDKFELVREMELKEINYEERYRGPIVIHLKDKATGTEFMAMNNHLARGKAEVRTWQAEKLVEWAREQTLPVLALGDYNFDFVFATESGNEGFRMMLRDNVWKWLRPTELIDTNWYDPAGDGEDDYPGSMLDFAFVAGPAKDWQATCNVVVREGDFPDDATTSDHRPVEVLISNP